ncbi:Excalibur calcium-binding domain [Haemophilus pittmaniae]|uniref:Excalibur calcium-binding domain n=2 Tax=Haemophilus pittmaniae TaxID=249188 RepID=A0A377J091_9PAST|nr:excalibur calcium-binding domain-containing protein [Haemophilus pittmaniae]STO93823.1 Excalibur calcium-binding domain [Haemophilus pittmaniae]
MKKIFVFLILCGLIPVVGMAESACDDGKRTCKDMDNCADARFHLEQCGMDKLDRDKDGIPCESICGSGKKKR